MTNGFAKLKAKINSKKAKIAVIGLGYVGLPLAIAFSRAGFKVLGLDVDKDRLDQLKTKKSYITDVSTAELRRILTKGNFSVSSDFRSLKDIDISIVCVPTPLKRKYHPDISYIRKAVRSISLNLRRNNLIILESTTYPGTTEEIILPILEGRGLKHAKDFYLCFSPERIDPGNQNFPLERIPKIVGGINRQATALGVLLYRKIIKKVLPVSSTRLAETVKLLENTFRIVNIGLINEMAMMADRLGVNIWEVIEAAKTKPFGFMPFYPGPGVGGHCIPKDPLYLYWKAKKFGFSSRFIKLASDTINQMPEYIVKRIKDVLSRKGIALGKAKILVVGVTYKKDVKDLRKSPAIDIIDILQRKQCRVFYHDPLIPYLKLNQINLRSVILKSRQLRRFDCVVIVTDHSAPDYSLILKNARCIFDTRNVYKNITDYKIFRL